MRPVSSFVLASVVLAGCGGRQLVNEELAEHEPSEHQEAEACRAPTDYEPCLATDDEPLAAVGLGCGDDPSVAIVLEDGALAASDPASWRVAGYFGVTQGDRLGARRWAPRELAEGHNLDERLLLLSTGRLPAVASDGGVIAAPGSQAAEGDNLNPDSGPLPPPLQAGPGSNAGAGGTPLSDCDGVHDCADSLAPLLTGGTELHDRVSLHAVLEAPEGTGTLAFDLAVFSAEYPEFVDTPFTDLFVAWVSSEAFTGNLALIEGRALTSTALAEAGWMVHEGDDPALTGTGFEGHGASEWLSLRAPVVPGESIELALLLADMGDPGGATVVLVDDLRWECERCDLLGGGCGLHPA
jgi:hypothetical protein